MKREELIQAFVEKKLGKEEKSEFDRLFETDPEFRKEVAFHKDLKTAFSTMERERLKTKLQQFESELKAPKQKTYAVWLAAACILVIVGVGLMTFFNKNSAPSQLYADYFEPYKNVVAPITRGETNETTKKATFVAYEKKEYEKAAKGFRALFENTEESYYLLYQANALMANNQIKEAVPLLEKHLAFDDKFADKSRWYLALAYLKTKEVEKVEKLLRKIVEENAYKTKEAKEILAQLN
ncbi:MAG TPA: hypothetical protein VFM65_04330 [Flavobacteriaceae bacterium]|nr:hypothetical protein [Flavobacteriaceae bacterium]